MCWWTSTRTPTTCTTRWPPHQLVEAFKATLEELEYADLLLHVIDVSNPQWQEQAEVVERLITELGAWETPRLDVYNKCDKVSGEIIPHSEESVLLSARTGEGVDQLLDKLRQRLDQGAVHVTLALPYDQGGLVDMLYREAKVEGVEYGETIQVKCTCTPKVLGRVRDYVVDGWTPPKEPWED